MTVNSLSNKVQYLGNGTTVSFPFPYVFFDPTDLVVTLYDTAARQPLSQQPVLNGSGTYGYQVIGTKDPASGEYLAGAAIVLNSAPLGNLELTALRDVAVNQNTSFGDNSKFPAKAVEAALDRLTMIDQQQDEQLGRAVLASPLDVEPQMVLPPAAVRAGHLSGFDGNGNVAVSAATIGQVDSLVSGALATTAAAGLTVIYSIGSIADLRATPGWLLAAADVKEYNIGSGVGGGIFNWYAGSTAADDGLVTFACIGVPVGRWVRNLQGVRAIDILWGGADPSNVIPCDSVFLAAFALGMPVLVPQSTPAGPCKFKTTTFIPVPSNTVLHVLGTINMFNQASGFDVHLATNVTIDGHGVGTITDDVIAASYVWNSGGSGPTANHAAIHIRSSTFCTVQNLNFTYCQRGIYITNFNQVAYPSNATGFSATFATDITIRDCNYTFLQQAGATGFNARRLTYNGWYSFRCGDGGPSMFGCIDFLAINGRNLSPYGNAATSPTLNDQQGMSFENCHNGRIAYCRAAGYYDYGIGVKNGSIDVTIEHCNVRDCQQSSIQVYEGDAAVQACRNIIIRYNDITNNGTVQTSAGFTGHAAGISVTNTFQTAIIGNTFYGYQLVPCIIASGPGAYLANYPSSPRQASLDVLDNRVILISGFQIGEPLFPATSTTPVAIVLTGLYDSIRANRNRLIASRYVSSDVVNTLAYAIQVVYDSTTVIGGVSQWPLSVQIHSNDITEWMGPGINVLGPGLTFPSGLSVLDNNVSYCTAFGIDVEGCLGFSVNNNTLIGCGSGGGYPNMLINGCKKGVVTGNTSAPRTLGGANGTTFGIVVSHSDAVLVTINAVTAGASGTIDISTGNTASVTAPNNV